MSSRFTIPPAKWTLYGTLPFIGLCTVAIVWGMVTTCLLPALEAPEGVDYLLLLLSFIGFSLLLKVLATVLHKLLRTLIFRVEGDELIIEGKLLRFKAKQEKSLKLSPQSKLTLTSRQILGEQGYEAITGKKSQEDAESEYHLRYLLILEVGEEDEQLIHESHQLKELVSIFDWLHTSYPSLAAENLLADEQVLAQHHAIKKAGQKLMIAFACVLLSACFLGYQWDSSSSLLSNLLHEPIFAVAISIGLLVQALKKAKQVKSSVKKP